MHEFLREDLSKRQYYYFEAALNFYANQILDDERLCNLFRQYGYNEKVFSK